jgi:hypothetical protein
LEEAEEAGTIVLAVFSPIRIHKDRSLLPERLLTPLRQLCERHPAVVISFSSPFLVAQFPHAAAWVLTYGMHPAQIEAAVRAVRQGGPFPGVLPVELPSELAGVTHGRQAPDEKGPSFA